MRDPNIETAALVEFLRQPSHYPQPTRAVEVIETHFAWVFLTDAYAYKLKKPLRHDCMDYRSLAARRRGCQDEVRLNKRLAPLVYLGVVPIVRLSEGTLRIGRSPGAVVTDWLVKMRRLPADRMLDHVLGAGRVGEAEFASLATLLGRFYAAARHRPLTARGYLARLRRAVRSNEAELAAITPHSRRARAVCRAQLAFIEQEARSLGARGALLVDAHGDLRPEHVFLGAGLRVPCVIDCLEFNRDLRRLDPAEELAFLILECRRLGSKSVGRALLARLAAQLQISTALLCFYMSQRAMTRAKLAIWHLRDPQFARRAALWRALAASYVEAAAHYIECASRAARWRVDRGLAHSSGHSLSRGVSGTPLSIRRRADPNSGAVERIVNLPSRSG